MGFPGDEPRFEVVTENSAEEFEEHRIIEVDEDDAPPPAEDEGRDVRPQ